MAYGLSNGHVTDDVTRPQSTGGYPTDSLAACCNNLGQGHKASHQVFSRLKYLSRERESVHEIRRRNEITKRKRKQKSQLLLYKNRETFYITETHYDLGPK